MNEKQPEYHCLINALRNKLLEVCVAEKLIFGSFWTVFIFDFKEGLGGQQLTHKMSLKVLSSIICHKLIIPILKKPNYSNNFLHLNTGLFF